MSTESANGPPVEEAAVPADAFGWGHVRSEDATVFLLAGATAAVASGAEWSLPAATMLLSVAYLALYRRVRRLR